MSDQDHAIQLLSAVTPVAQRLNAVAVQLTYGDEQDAALALMLAAAIHCVSIGKSREKSTQLFDTSYRIFEEMASLMPKGWT